MSISTASWQARNLASIPLGAAGWLLTAASSTPFVIPIGPAVPIGFAWENDTGFDATTVQISYATDNPALDISSPNPEDINSGNVVSNASTGTGAATMTASGPPGSAVVTAIFTGLEAGTTNLLTTTATLNVTWA